MASLEIPDEALTVVRSATIGFVLLNQSEVASSGSGTLISFGSVSGILTCAHAALRVAQEAQIGIVRFQTRGQQRLRFETIHLDPVTIGGPEWTATGPDIAFLRLSEFDVSRLKSSSVFLDGNKLLHDLTAPEADTNLRYQCVAGVLAELTKQTGETPTHKSFAIEGRIARCAIDPHSSRGGDLDVLSLIHEPEDELPESFQGTSGGGLWRFYLRENNEKVEVVHRRFLGVVFWERPDGTGLNAHGPGSLHSLHRVIRSRWDI